MESVGFGPALPLQLPLFCGAIIGEQLEGWAPLFEFHLPIQHH